MYRYIFSYLHRLFLVWFSQNKIIAKIHRQLFFCDASYALLIWILTALYFRAVTANTIVTFSHSMLISFCWIFSFCVLTLQKASRSKFPIWKFSLSGSIKTEVHALGFDIFAKQMIFHARCRAFVCSRLSRQAEAALTEPLSLVIPHSSTETAQPSE